MRIAILTKEYPPHVYGGAGVHVTHLARELARLGRGKDQVTVLCFGDQREEEGNLIVRGVGQAGPIVAHDPRLKGLLDSILRQASLVGALEGAEVIHGHTWYTHLAGCLLKQMLGAPLILTTHSLEPHRPWKEEQLGPAYRASTWLEKTAYRNADGVIAVSASMKADVQSLYGVAPERIEVIHNGIDPAQYRPRLDRGVLARYDIEPDEPYVLMVGRMTRQKGINHFLNAAKYLRPEAQVVVCASAPDTTEILIEVARLVEEARARVANHLIWVQETVPADDLVALYSQAAVFVCPSVYEPFGIINLEAMACGAPVVASAVGGVPEVVSDGQTGRLVKFEARGPADPEPLDPDGFARALAEAVNDLLSDPRRREVMGSRARQRAVERFSWTGIARQTREFYGRLIGERG